jgi:hypothetical protein
MSLCCPESHDSAHRSLIDLACWGVRCFLVVANYTEGPQQSPTLASRLVMDLVGGSHLFRVCLFSFDINPILGELGNMNEAQTARPLASME